MTWSLLGGLMPPAVDATKENKVKSIKNSGDSGNYSEAEEEQNTNRATRLEFKLTQSLLSKVKANENSADANSGKQAYIDLPRMNFIINGKTISKDFVGQLCDRYNQELQSNKRQVAKHVLIEMFKHAEAEVPGDHILKELITNCNQAGYDGSLLMQLFPIFFKHNLKLPDANDRKISIICNSQDYLNIQYYPNMPVKERDTNREICRLDSISEFTLKSQNGKVEYEEGKVTLTIPEQLKNYQAEDKSLLDDINEYFKDADNAVVESLEATFSEGPKSFVIDQESLNSDEGLSLVIVPESSVYDLGDMAKLVKEAIDNKNVDALNTYIDVVQAGVTRVPPEEGLLVVEKILEIISNFTKEQGKAWSCYPTAPIVSNVYAITEWLQGYISYEDYNKAINLEKVLNSIITRLSNNEKSSGSKTALSKENSNTVNSTEISTQESVTANNCKGNKENKQQTPYKVIIPTKYKSVSNIIPIAASNNQSENPGLENSGSQQPQENVDRRENIMNNEKASIEEAIGNDYRRGKMGKNSAKKRKERIKRSKEEKKKNEQEKEVQFRELYVGKNDGSKVITEVDSSKKKQAPGQLAGYVEQTGGLGSSNDNNPLDNGTNSEKNSTFKTDEQDTKPAPILEPVPSVASENSEQEDGTQTTTRQQEPNPIPTPTPAPTPNLAPTSNPIPTLTPAPTPQPTPALKPTLIPSVANNKSEQVNDTQTNGKLPNNRGNGSITATQNTQKSNWPTVATWTFAVAGILAGAAATAAYFAFSVSLLTTGIIAGVGVCCLVAAVIIYCCNRSSSSLEGSNVEPVANGKLVEQQ